MTRRLVLAVAVAALSAVAAEPVAGFIRVAAGSEAWHPGTPPFPSKVQVAVLHGDPSKAGPFTVRVKFAKGTVIGPHTHPCDERTTVLSGAVLLGEGTTFDEKVARRLSAGSFYLNPKGAAHAVRFEEETVLQISADGPWGVDLLK